MPSICTSHAFVHLRFVFSTALQCTAVPALSSQGPRSHCSPLPQQRWHQSSNREEVFTWAVGRPLSPFSPAAPAVSCVGSAKGGRGELVLPASLSHGPAGWGGKSRSGFLRHRGQNAVLFAQDAVCGVGRVEPKNRLCSLMKVPDLSARVLIYAFNAASCFLLHLLLLKFSDVNVNRHEQTPRVLKSLYL